MARRKIVIQTPYYVLTDEVIQALREAGQRGVEIRIRRPWTNSRPQCSKCSTTLASRARDSRWFVLTVSSGPAASALPIATRARP